MVFACARTQLTSRDRERLEHLLNGPLDWAEVLRAALPNGMGPLLLMHIDGFAEARIPASVLEQLRTEAVRVAARSLYLARQLTKVLRALASKNIPAIAFKGPTLALQAYGDISLRSFGDLDILVPETQVERAREVLFAQGFTAKYPERLSLSRTQFDAFVAAEYNDEFERRGDGAKIEIHWNFAPRFFGFGLDPTELWDRAEQLRVNGQMVDVLSREDLLLVLCVHGAEHAWASLEGIVALAELMRDAEAIDWAAVVERAERARVGRVLRLGLLLAVDLLAAPVPEWVSAKLRSDARAVDLAQGVAENLFTGDMDPRLEAHRPRLLSFYLASKDRWTDQARFCFRLAATPSERDWRMVRLPDRLYPLYWLLRPFRLVARLPRYGRWGAAD